MKRKTEEKLKAIALREEGYTVNEIVEKVGVAKGSVSVWVRNVSLSEGAKSRLLTKINLRQIHAAESKRQKIQKILENHAKIAQKSINEISLGIPSKRLICSLLYWCEGAKNHYQGVNFTNSDPRLITAFLKLLREGFSVDETKFRASLHIHQYHNPEAQISFWSEVTHIPQNQFIKPYIKPNTGKRIRKDYPGCITIRYHNNDMARQLLVAAQSFFQIYGGVG